MPTGPPRADHTQGHDASVLARLAGRGARGRTGSPHGGGRYGLLLLVLVGTYLFSAFGGKQLATELQVLLFALVLLIALRTSAQNGGRAVAVLEALTGQVFLATLVARLVAAYRNPAQPEPSGRGRLPEDVDGPGDDEDRD
jgi:hypothetical protein